MKRGTEASIAPVADATHFLAEASGLLAASLDYRVTLEKLAQIAVPFLCDWCAIDVVEDGRFDRIGVAHVDPGKAALVREMQLRYPPGADAPAGYPKVMRTAESDFFPVIPDSALAAAAKDPEHLQMMRELGYRGLMCVALVARGRTLGTMTLVIADPERPAFTSEDLVLCEDLARRAALAVDNARLFDEAAVASRRARLLAEASRVLVESLDHRATVAKVARLVVPELGDSCVIHLVGEDGVATPTAVAVAHVDAALSRAMEERLRSWPKPPQGVRGIRRVIDTGEPELFREITPEELEKHLGAHPEYLAFIRDVFNPRSTIILPLKARGEAIGTLTLSRTCNGRLYSEADFPLAQDLADRIALAVSNSRLYERAEGAVRARDEFLSIASHELRTPLTALQLVVRMLRMEQHADVERLQIASRQLDRIAKLIAMLFDISRVTDGKLALELEDVDLSSVARDVVERFEGEAKEASCRIEVDAQSVVGRWDRFRLEQVVTNLLSNAVKYGRGKPIHLVVERGGAGARLIVRDHGAGIGPEQLPSIFERFSRGRGARRYDGLGLGLYIVRQILDALGGTIEVESKPNEGAAFRVELPLAPPRD